MKKFAFFMVFVILAVAGISYKYLNYKANYNMVKKNNLEFEQYVGKDIYGTDLSTLINKAIDNNEKNQIQKNNKGFYIDNNKNSISIEIKIIDNEKLYKMETLYNGGIQNFVNYYSQIKFSCTQVDYHKDTKNIKYMLFEQITS